MRPRLDADGLPVGLRELLPPGPMKLEIVLLAKRCASGANKQQVVRDQSFERCNVAAEHGQPKLFFQVPDRGFHDVPCTLRRESGRHAQRRHR
jgi:hypothetical protein